MIMFFIFKKIQKLSQMSLYILSATAVLGSVHADKCGFDIAEQSSVNVTIFLFSPPFDPHPPPPPAVCRLLAEWQRNRALT